MPAQARLTDMTVGHGSHGQDCCPHTIIGIFITGSPNHQTNNLLSVRLTDITAHNCPHCPIGMAITASPDKFINNLGAHRVGDVVTEFCGTGVTVTGSPNRLVD